MRVLFPGSVLALGAIAAMTGCNGVAGISDLITGDLDGSFDASSEASGDASNDDAGQGTGDGGVGSEASIDAGVDADVPPACPLGKVGLRITVADSSQFTAVRDDSNGITVAVGATYANCFLAGTQFELQADPDTSNANHDWGSACVAGRRCAFTLVTAMTIDVKL